MRGILTAAAFALVSTTAVAENFTTAAEVRPILGATQGFWIAVREFNGQDLLYFTNLLSWRCGLTSIHYSVNGEEELTEWTMEPCYEDEAAPNAQKMEDQLPYTEFELGSVQTITVEIVYDDGEVTRADYERGNVMTP